MKDEYIKKDELVSVLQGIRLNLYVQAPDFQTRDSMLLNFEQTVRMMDGVVIGRCRQCARGIPSDKPRITGLYCTAHHHAVQDDGFCNHYKPREKAPLPGSLIEDEKQV